eukprot:145990_1
MWEIVTGKEPYPNVDPMDAAIHVLVHEKRPQSYAFIPEKIQNLMNICWHKHPKKRPDADKIVQILDEFITIERQKKPDTDEVLTQSITTESQKTFVSLHRFTPEILYDHIKQWVLGDVNYQNNLSETKRKFVQRELHGQIISTQPMNNTTDMVEKDLLSTSLVTPKTFQIIMAYCEEWKDRNSDSLKFKS